MIRNAAPTSGLLRRLRGRRREEEEIEVDLSPLIDCVFLLLIFFLVTTMLKKLEKQIPVVLPDYTAALSAVSETDVIVFGLDAGGRVYRAADTGRTLKGLTYEALDDFGDELRSIAQDRGGGVPIRVDAERDTPVQQVIDVLDALTLQGFQQVGVRLRHREKEMFGLKEEAPDGN
jgi:biopolymer transport protein ExbD